MSPCQCSRLAFAILPTNSFSLNQNSSPGLDAGEEIGSRFVGATFGSSEFGLSGNEFAPEGFGEDGLRQFFSSCCRDRYPGFNGVCQTEQGLDAADDLALFLKRGKR